MRWAGTMEAMDSRSGRPAGWLVGRKRSVIALRMVMTLAVTAVTLSILSEAKATPIAVLAIYAASNLVLCFEKPASFLRRVPFAMLFVFDVGVVTTLMLAVGERGSHFYIAFFLIILLAALTRSARFAGAIAIVSAVVYAILVGVERPSDLLDIGFTTRVALFFVTALFAGYLAEEAQAERRETARLAREVSEKHEAVACIEAFYRTLFDESADGVLVAGPDGVIREANARAKQIMGRDPTGMNSGELLNLSDTHIVRLAPVDASGPLANLTFTVNFVHPDATSVACEVTIKSLTIEDQTHRLLLLRDVGELRQMQQRVVELEKRSMLGEFVASITHEINNPLTVVLGYAEMLKSGAIPSTEVPECAGYILDGAQRCKRVVDAFLNQCRERPFAPRPTRLGDVARSVARLMEFHMRYHLVKFSLEIADDPVVMADAQQLEQLLINLMSNAVKAMERRSPRLLKLRVAASGDSAAIEVTDSGCGIPPDVLARLFRRGFTAREDGSGHGLGLALCQEIAHRHGGHVSVESQPGSGSTFCVRLPVPTGP